MLVVEKVTETRFELILDGGNPISDNQPNMTTFGSVVHFKTASGAPLIKNQNLTFADVTVRDTFGGTGDFTFQSIGALWLKLVELNFFNGVANAGGGSGGSTTFAGLLDTFTYFGNNGKVPVVNESEQKLVATQFFNFDKFTQLSDVAIANLLENKIVGTAVVNGQIKLTLVDPPSQTSNEGRDNVSKVIKVTQSDLTPYTGILEEKIAQFITTSQIYKSDIDAEIWVEFDGDEFRQYRIIDVQKGLLNLTKANLYFVGGRETQRKRKVISFINAALPPEFQNEGDRYIIEDNNIATHPSWGNIAVRDIVEFKDGVWVAETPKEGWVVYVDDLNKDAVYVDDGTPQWEVKSQVNNTSQLVNDGSDGTSTYVELSYFNINTLQTYNNIVNN